MKRILIVALALALFNACSDRQSLQEYYVDNSENPNFIALDLPASILNLDSTNLTSSQREAIGTLRKLNVLAFRRTAANEAEFNTEKEAVRAILEDSDYVELMKLNSKFGKGVIKYLGDEDAIDEVVIFGNSEEQGFAVIRVLGKNMNPAHIMQVLQAIRSSDNEGQQLGEIGSFLKG